MTFAQLTYRESLRETEICLRAQSKKLYHMGIRGGIARNTLSNANKVRDWRIYADFAQALIRIARPLYAEEDLGLELDNTIYALDSSTIDLCLSVFPWALFRSTKSAIKLHTLLDLRGNIPTFIHISDGKMHDVNILDILIPEAGAFYIMDRGYVDFERLFRINQAGAFFVTRLKKQYSIPASIFSRCHSRGKIAWNPLRSNHHTHRRQLKERLPSAVEASQILRQKKRQDLQLSDQQLCHSSTDGSRPLSLPLAGRTLLQMDQATPENQIILRNIRECSEESNMDSHLSLCTGGDHKKAARHQNRALHNITDFKPDTIRENTSRSTAYEF